MKDLQRLNQCIAEYWLGELDPAQQAYLGHAPVCLGWLPYRPSDILETLENAKAHQAKRGQLIALNKRYLHMARLASKDAASGNVESLIRFGMNWEQAQVLARLSDDEICLLAQVWNGPIVQFSAHPFLKGANLKGMAGQHHATAFISTRTQ